MTQKLTTLENDESSMPKDTDIIMPVEYDARIESFAKYILSLRTELPKKPKHGNAVLIDNADDTDNDTVA